MTDVLGDLLAKRRDRAIAAILSCKERELDPLLGTIPGRGAEASVKLRRVVLDQLHDMHQLYVDVIGSFEADQAVAINELWLEKLDAIHEAVVKARARSA